MRIHAGRDQEEKETEEVEVGEGRGGTGGEVRTEAVEMGTIRRRAEVAVPSGWAVRVRRVLGRGGSCDASESPARGRGAGTTLGASTEGLLGGPSKTPKELLQSLLLASTRGGEHGRAVRLGRFAAEAAASWSAAAAEAVLAEEAKVRLPRRRRRLRRWRRPGAARRPRRRQRRPRRRWRWRRRLRSG